MPWTRALRATVDTPKESLAVYTAHLASVRVHPSTGFATTWRNKISGKLVAAPVLVVGGFNGTTDDTTLPPITVQVKSAQEAGDRVGSSWPAAFPAARIDQILTRDITPVASWTLPRTGERPPARRGLLAAVSAGNGYRLAVPDDNL